MVANWKKNICPRNPWNINLLYYIYEKFRSNKFHLNGNQGSSEGAATGKNCHIVAMEVLASHTKQ